MSENLPSYDELPLIEGLDIRHAWDVFGRDDVLGSMNLLTDERVARAAALVTTGRRIPLDLPLDLPSPPLFGREPFDHIDRVRGFLQKILQRCHLIFPC